MESFGFGQKIKKGCMGMIFDDHFFGVGFGGEFGKMGFGMGGMDD